jgi:MFS family permease
MRIVLAMGQLSSGKCQQRNLGADGDTGEGACAAASLPTADYPYGRVVLRTLSLTLIISYGTLFYAYGVTVKPMQAELGWSRAAISGAFSLALLVAALIAWPVGRWLDRRGPRGLMSCGSLLNVFALLAWSHAHQPWQLYGAFLLVGTAMAMVLYDPAFAVIAKWFPLAPREALMFLTVFGGLAGIVFTPLTSVLVGAVGWRSALVTLAVVVAFASVLPHVLLLRSAPQDERPPASSAPDGAPPVSVTAREALRGLAFWALTGAILLSALAWMGLFAHLVPYLTDRGLTSGSAALCAGLVGAMQIPGRAMLIPLAQRIPRRLIVLGSFGVQAFALLVLTTRTGPGSAFVFAVAFGAARGLIVLLRADLLADFYGPVHYGAIGGISAFFIGVAQAVSPLMAGLIHDRSGGYGAVMWVLCAAVGLAIIAATVAERSAPARGKASLTIRELGLKEAA